MDKIVEKVTEKLIEIIKTTFDDIEIEVIPDTQIVLGGLNLDSLQLVVFIGSTEEYFGFEFDFEVLDEDSFTSIKNFARIITDNYSDQVTSKLA